MNSSDDNNDTAQPQVVEIETTNRPPFSFKKMALGWGVVILIIVIASIAVDVAVHGW